MLVLLSVNISRLSWIESKKRKTKEMKCYRCLNIFFKAHGVLQEVVIFIFKKNWDLLVDVAS